MKFGRLLPPLAALCLPTVSRAASSELAEAIGNVPAKEQAYDIVINGTLQGRGAVQRVGDVLYIDATAARAAGLTCARAIPGNDGADLCAVTATHVVVEGQRFELTVGPQEFATTYGGGVISAPPLPEMTPSNLGFINYNLGGSLVSNNDFAFAGSLNAGLRLDENAFDIGGVVTRTANANGQNSVYGNDLLSFTTGAVTGVLTDAAYRRNWFDQRLTLTAGRSSLQSRGFIGGALFDGVGLSRDNLDNLGDVRSTQSRKISGYNPVAGLLSYRIGDTVLKQVPLPAGPYSIDPALFSGFPTGGHIEITRVDGSVASLDLPLAAYQRQALFPAGTYDWNVQAGRVQTARGGYVAAASGGARYGVNDNLSVQLATIIDTKSGILDAGADMRLPGRLGNLSAEGAWQWRSKIAGMTGLSNSGWSLESFYDNQIGPVGFGADYLRNGHGGVFVGGYRGLRFGNDGTLAGGSVPTSINNTQLLTSEVLGSLVREDIRLYASLPLFKTGISGTVRLTRTDYADQPVHERYAEVQLGGGLGRLGTWGASVRTGETGYRQSAFSGNLYWRVPLGRRIQGGLAYQTDRLGGERTSPDRYEMTLNGSTSSHWYQDTTYALTVDQNGDGSASVQHESSKLSTSASVFHDQDAGWNGNVSARGSLVFADGKVIAGRSLSDSIVVLAAPDLPAEDVFLDTADKPTTRTDANGYAVISRLRSYKPNSARVDDTDAPLGMEIPDNVLPATVHPYRGYIVKVAAHLARPARLFAGLPSLPLNAMPVADIADNSVPVEADGSIYVDDLDRLTRDVTVSWQRGDTPEHCTIDLATIKRIAAEQAAETVVRPVKGLQCR